jgi:hypothetical protein
MAITGADRGTGTNVTATTFTTFSPATNFAAMSMAVLCVSADNSATSGSSNNINTVTDSHGNTWTKRASPLFDNGAASAGIQGAFFTSNMDKEILTTGSTITTTFGANTTSDTWTLMEIVPTSSAYRIRFVDTANNTGATVTAGGSMSLTTGSIAINNMVICAIFSESGTGQAYTADSDTTNGSWSTIQYAEVGTTATGNTIGSQRKVVSAAATQTYNITVTEAADSIMSYIQLTEELFTIRDPIGSGDGIVVGPRTLRAS